MYINQTLADELAAIRARISELRAREAVIEADLRRAGPDVRLRGFYHDAVIERTAHSVFDISRLPLDILDDPAFQSTRVVTQVRIEARDATRKPAALAVVPRTTLVAC
ncbi:hypothetical protein AQS8620_00913 [Aquimixticola soesokkakensis]|uniref:Uncharacterized protein n=1 Tax=Aquimixticola soesokkakensis TaxID=1519096 RepID=A0A1Y5RZR6_9RHOB|nr:hypothetical protein [Aquimixticola soesokkakensis]SLN29461.1 hypothetical protein AQS8620_00913 [Aquimixticola soesokkakensis]